uniref:Solute carrier family 25 member 33 n=1 Tax=Callorhinchus milii TaxID=7868 RepID=A0A4W3GKV6_CALMI
LKQSVRILTRVLCFTHRCGGTVGAIVTCPLEVIKTRLQSSGLTLRQVYIPQVNLNTINGPGVVRPTRVAPGLFQVLKMILEKEGPRSLFRGLGPNLIGVAPSRAIYFAAYSKAKEHCNTVFVPHSNLVHMCSAGFASTCPGVFVYQLKRSEKVMNAFQCAKHVYRAEGFKGFYRGLTASYAGISETMIHFVTYEAIKKHLEKSRFNSRETDKTASDFLGLMLAAGFSKTCASCAAYPHEVIRTRLREEGTKYKTFLQTARVVAMEEGYSAFYRGLQAQLIRQIPNTAIMMTTYEVIIYVFGHH